VTRAVRPSRSGRTQSLAGFDGLRALAALAVLSYHVWNQGRFAGAGWFAPVLWELKGGVTVFFVISGALLYLPYARAIRVRGELPHWRAYLHRRAVRILPAYWVALTIVGVGPFHAGVFGPGAWRYYSLSQIYASWTASGGGLQVAWTLCVEVTFYALLPIFAWLVSRLVLAVGRRHAPWARLGPIAALGVGSLVLRYSLAGSLTATFEDQHQTVLLALPGALDWFAIGMWLAVLRAELEAGGAARSRVAALGRRPGWCVCFALLVFLVAAPLQPADMPLPWYAVSTQLALGVGAGLLVLAVIVPRPRRRDPWPIRLLNHPAAVWIGTISYGVYLWHYPLLELIGGDWLLRSASSGAGAVMLTWLAVGAASLACGAASWYLVERPLQRAFKRREKRTSTLGRTSEIDVGVQSVADALNPTGVAVDHLA
jgi:peptidoglycan/LPS O-acetylase OafA/YrhL